MKKIILASLVLLSVLFLIAGCGQGSGGGGTPAPAPVESVSLSGSISSGLISSAGVKALSALPSGYTVVAVDNHTNQTYFSNIDSNGNFELNVPADASYEVSLIDNNSRYAGPIVMVGNSSSSEVVMGVNLTEDASLGAIVYSPSQGYALPDTQPTGIADYADRATASTGVPAGAGDYGINASAVSATREGSDMDADGIPNVFDIDEDGDTFRNGILGAPTSSTVISNTIEAVFLSMNLWRYHGITPDPGNEISLRIIVDPIDGMESYIQSVSVEAVPASIATVSIVASASSLGEVENYPIEGSLWSLSNFGMYRTTISGEIKWIISIHPVNLPQIGDIFKITVTYAGGSTQSFYQTISYVLTSIPSITTYNGIAVPPDDGGSYHDPIRDSFTGLNVVFIKPTDETGAVLEGFNYSIIVNYISSEGSRLGTWESGSFDDWNSFAIEDNTPSSPTLSFNTGTLTTEAYPEGVSDETVAIDSYYICPVAEPLGSDQRNGEEYWFKMN
ncbi:MAG: hypothetical protein ABIC39_06995 [Pseudomonadota bacterium]